MKRTTILMMLLFLMSNLFSQEKEWKPEDTEVWEPVPPKVTPGKCDLPPSDAMVLFDGTGLDAWESVEGGPAPWEAGDGFFTVVPGTGSIQTTREFGDCQLHVEWKAPFKVQGTGQDKGNSGIFLQKRYEIQVLDCYENETYVNGMTGSVYKQHIPLVNACKSTGEWQTYDIIFMAPRFHEDGSLKKPATVTVLHNGVLIQNHVGIKGTIKFIGPPEYETHDLKQPLMLQDHGNPVVYRNIWIREL